MSTASILYTLIVVTGTGTVTHSDGFKSLHMCEEAASIAQTGKTLEESKALDEQASKGSVVKNLPGAVYSWVRVDPLDGRGVVHAECVIEPPKKRAIE